MVAQSEAVGDVESVMKTIQKIKNIEASDSLSINQSAIESANPYQLRFRYAKEFDSAQGYENFQETYHYLFPEREIDLEHLFYFGHGERSVRDENGNAFRFLDHQDQILNGTEDILFFYYNEQEFYGEGKKRADGNMVLLMAGAPFGSNVSRFCRGQLAKYQRTGLELPFPTTEITCVCGPNDSTTYKLSDDKEISINDAVTFFEDYINGIPMYMTEENERFLSRVNNVEVYPLVDDSYLYRYNLQVEYDGLRFDLPPVGGYFEQEGLENFFPFMAMGYMVQTDEVDYADAVALLVRMDRKENISDVISAESALRVFSSKLTAHVKFELDAFDMVYVESYDDFKVGAGVDDAYYIAEPCWKAVFYNANDDCTYICYLNVSDQNDFRYFKCSGRVYK